MQDLKLGGSVKYTINIIEMTVSDFGENGQGDKSWSKGWVNNIGDLDHNDVSLDNIAKVLGGFIGADLLGEDLDIHENFGSFSIVENENGIPDLNGKFIVNYTFELIAVNTVLLNSIK